MDRHSALRRAAGDGGYFDAPERGVAYYIDGPAWVNNHAHILRCAGASGGVRSNAWAWVFSSTEHQRMLRRVHIEPDDVTKLLNEERIG
jgi:hypothetical protein